jgi:hypothetical protein
MVGDSTTPEPVNADGFAPAGTDGSAVLPDQAGDQVERGT